jgi:predicted RNase H-like nuclease (RuvC/YqgF family)
MNSMIANITSQLRKENVELRKEFSNKLESEVEALATEIDTVRKNRGLELMNLGKNVEGI